MKARFMSKARQTADKANQAAQTAISTSAEALKTGFEKAVKSYETVSEFSKDNIEALTESLTVAGKGVGTINSEYYAYSKKTVDDTLAVTKAIMASKSVHEALELQTDFAKSAYEAYVGQLTKFGKLFTTTAKDTFAPLQVRVEAFAEAAQSAQI
jgi:phasin family protein